MKLHLGNSILRLASEAFESVRLPPLAHGLSQYLREVQVWDQHNAVETAVSPWLGHKPEGQ